MAPSATVKKDTKKPRTAPAVSEKAPSSSTKPAVSKSGKPEKVISNRKLRVQPPPSSLPLKKGKAAASTAEGTSASEKKVEAKEQDFSRFDSDSESSDDEDDDGEVDDGPVKGIELLKIPTVDKDETNVKKRLEKAKKKNDQPKGVLYLGRIPHGFYEDQMKGYFSQFGDVEKLRLARNKKTGKSKHYAFLQFANLAVAEIVAETMDNYLLMGHILRCKVIPNDEVHPALWIGSNRKWRAVPSVRVERARLDQPRTKEQQIRAETRLLKRQAAKKDALKAHGIDYTFDGYTATA